MKRDYGIDFLRIISMFMIVVLHVLGQGGILSNVPFSGPNYYCLWFLEVASFCAVDVYAIISGYVGIDSKYKLSNLVYLWIQVLFYSLGITIVFYVWKSGNIGQGEVWKSMFVISNDQYWYFTAYVCLFIFMPLLNKGINSMDNKSLVKLVTMIYIFLSIVPTFLGKDVFRTFKGGSAFWLIALYVLGAFIKKSEHFNKRIIWGWLYVLMILFTWGTKMIIEYFSLQMTGKGIDGGLLISYTSPTIVASAVFLLLAFRDMKFQNKLNKVIRVLSGCSFSVYLIHAHPLIFEVILKNNFVYIAKINVFMAITKIFSFCLLIYFVCTLVDLIREKLFLMLKVKGTIKKIAKE